MSNTPFEQWWQKAGPSHYEKGQIGYLRDAGIAEAAWNAATKHVLSGLNPEAVNLLSDSLKEVRLVVNMDPSLHHLRSEPWWERLNGALARLEESHE